MNKSELIVQFSTAAPDWRRWVPLRARKPKPLCIFGDKNWATPLIRRMCHSPFSHLDIVLPDGHLLGASDSPKAPVIEGNPRGVAIRPFDYQSFGYRRQMVLKTERADDIRAIAKTQLGKEFDNVGLREMLSDNFPGARNWRMDDNWFCAELVAFAMEAGGLFGGPLLWPKNRVSPSDLLMLFLLDARWINQDIFWAPVPGLKLGPSET